VNPGASIPGSGRRPPSLVDGEFVLTAQDFAKISAMLYADAGISLPESKATLVYSRLAKRLRALGLESFRAYCALVAGDDGLDERQNMLAALTTNVTRSFREPHHFEHLKTKLLPPLLEEAQRGGKVRIWSAACSNGQEPYSIALTVLSLLPDAGRYDIKILATDIDPNMVADGREGVYDRQAVDSIPLDLRRRWCTPVATERGEGVGMAEEVRALVAFRELNLIGNWPMKGRFQAIFCRNVVIYFDEPTQSRLWSRFLPLLSPGGRLYIGHSERLCGEAAQRFDTDGITTYRLREAA
jgi:chemotaxis protein methyltransferase CheR